MAKFCRFQYNSQNIVCNFTTSAIESWFCFSDVLATIMPGGSRSCKKQVLDISAESCYAVKLERWNFHFEYTRVYQSHI